MVTELIYKWMQRYEIVNGVAEVEGVASETTAEAEEDKGSDSNWYLTLLFFQFFT